MLSSSDYRIEEFGALLGAVEAVRRKAVVLLIAKVLYAACFRNANDLLKVHIAVSELGNMSVIGAGRYCLILKVKNVYSSRKLVDPLKNVGACVL